MLFCGAVWRAGSWDGGLGEDLELVALVPRLLQQAGCGGLAAEEQHLALW